MPVLSPHTCKMATPIALTQQIRRYCLLAGRAKVLRDNLHIGKDQRSSDNRLTVVPLPDQEHRRLTVRRGGEGRGYS